MDCGNLDTFVCHVGGWLSHGHYWGWWSAYGNSGIVPGRDLPEGEPFHVQSHGLETLLTQMSDCQCRSNRLRLDNPYGQNLYSADVSPDLRHRCIQEGHMGRWRGIRCMGHSCNPLPHISMPPFLWTVESAGHLHKQVLQPTGLLQGSCRLEHGA